MQRKLKHLLGKTAARKKDGDHAERPPTADGELRDVGPPHVAIMSTDPDAGWDAVPERGRSMSVSVTQQGMQEPKPGALNRSRSNELRPAVEYDDRSPNPNNNHHPRGSPSQDYATCAPAANSRGGSMMSKASQTSSEAARRRYNEDVADRNISIESGANSRHSSVDQTTTNRSSVGRGSLPGSLGGNEKSLTAETVPEDAPVRAYDSSPSPLKSEQSRANRGSWPIRSPRDEAGMGARKRQRVQESTGGNSPRSSDYGPRINKDDFMSHKTRGATDGQDDPRAVQQQKERLANDPRLRGVVDLRNTEDVDKTTTWAPAVTHETVKPIQHEIKQEVVYRDIHNHDVYHRIQPVIETEILPPRHFIQDPADPTKLTEVSEDQLPPRSRETQQRWFIGEKEIATPTSADHAFPPEQARLTRPKVVDETTHVTSEGYVRKDTIIVHPSTLEDMRGYKGPVLDMSFEHAKHNKEDKNVAATRANRGIDHTHTPELLPMRSNELPDRATVIPGSWPAPGPGNVLTERADHGSFSVHRRPVGSSSAESEDR